ncbi:MAG: hypothetical protein JSW20_10895 [Nitrospiraceae bacterium]|nr:MAG: hypothetical protein JSW20_10895 [Nitrospiraceae bacterium]
MNDISIPEENTESTESRKLPELKKMPVIHEVLWRILTAFPGLAAYKKSGLYDAVSSNAGLIFIGGVIIYCYLAVFIRGL